MSGKKILAIGFVFVLLVAIPLTVYLVQQQQKTKSGATAATILSLSPPSTEHVTPGTNVALAVNVIPVNNLVSFVKFTISYDPTKLAKTGNDSLKVNTWKATDGKTTLPDVLQGPVYTNANGIGTMSMTISVEGDPANVISGENPVQI